MTTTRTSLSGARVAIVFEWFQQFGAAERVILQPGSQYMIHRTVSAMLEEAPASSAMIADSAAAIASTDASLLLAATLRRALRQILGKLFVIWDGSSIHRSKVVQQFPRSGANAQLQLEQVPGYASELNLDDESGSARSMRNQRMSAAGASRS
jgi:hypothetical protein